MKTKKKRKIIIDTDPAIGLPLKDVDDALAILLMLSSRDVDVLGLTINFGNTSLENAYEKAKEVLAAAGRKNIPVLKGAKNKKDYGRETEASRFIALTLKKYPDEVSVLAIAPLTNIATVMQNNPDAMRRVKKLVIMGGAVKKFPFAEFNFLKDPRAAKTALAFPVKKVLFPIDICMQVTFSWLDFVKLGNAGNIVTEYLCKNILPWLALNTPVTGRGFFPWDTVAAAHFLDPALFQYKTFYVDERRSAWRRGLVKLKDIRANGDTSALIVPQKLKAKEFKALFVEQMRNF